MSKRQQTLDVDEMSVLTTIQESLYTAHDSLLRLSERIANLGVKASNMVFVARIIAARCHQSSLMIHSLWLALAEFASPQELVFEPTVEPPVDTAPNR